MQLKHNKVSKMPRTIDVKSLIYAGVHSDGDASDDKYTWKRGKVVQAELDYKK